MTVYDHYTFAVALVVLLPVALALVGYLGDRIVRRRVYARIRRFTK